MVLRWVGRITDELIGSYSSLKWGYRIVSELKGGSPSLVLEDQGWWRGVEEKVKSLSQAFGNNTWGLQEERAWEIGSLLWLEQKRGGGKE